MRPDLDELLTTLLVGDQAPLVLALHLVGAALVVLQDRRLVRRRDDILDRDRDTRPGGPVEAGVLERVKGRRHLDLRVGLGERVDDDRQRLPVHQVVDEREVGRQRLVEDAPAQRGGQPDGNPCVAVLGSLGPHVVARRDDAGQPDLDLGVQGELARVVGHQGLGQRGERPARARRVLGLPGQAVQADDHVLGGHGDRLAVGGLEDVVGGQHQDPRLGLRLGGQRQVHRHLVAVEVRVERGADQRVDLDGLALDQLRLEGLDAEAVQRRRPVQQHRVLGDDLLEHVPHDRAGPLHHPLGRLDVLRVVEVNQALHHERLEQLQGHLLGQTALVQLELRTDDDDASGRCSRRACRAGSGGTGPACPSACRTGTSAGGCPAR